MDFTGQPCQRQKAMFYVVVEELIPEASSGKHSNLSTIGFAIGFVLMMVLDSSWDNAVTHRRQVIGIVFHHGCLDCYANMENTV